MNVRALVIAIAAGLLAYVVIMLALRWSARRAGRRFGGEFGDASRTPAPLMPESLFIVELSDAGVSCSRPDRTVERVAWDDLQSVELVNTDEGPFAADVFWVLNGTAGGCAVPQGATGEQQMLERLQTLPGFDNGAVIDAMSTFTNRRTLCWKRPPSADESTR